MLSVDQITKSYFIEKILDGVTFTVNPGERLGLVGPNGCGKTTLMRIITGEEKPNSGVVRFTPSSLRTGYLPQGFEFPQDDTLGGFIRRMEGDVSGLSERLGELAAELAGGAQRPDLQEEYDRILDRLALAAESQGRAPVVLAALGLDVLPDDLPVTALSGGQKTRLALAGVLLSNPQLLLLDEPTNHLDIQMLQWLESWLANYNGAVLMVSHDRIFLDHTVTAVLELDPKTRKVKRYEGNYSAYLEQKQGEMDKQWQEYTDQQEEIFRLKRAASAVRDNARFKKGGKADSGDKFAKGFFANRSLETNRRAKSIEKRVEKMLTEDRVEKPRASWQIKIEFGDLAETGRDVLVMEHLDVGYGDLTLLHDLNLTLRYGRRVALIGPNGCGKTSLIKTFLGRIPALHGSFRLGTHVQVGYMAQEQEDLRRGENALTTILRLSNYNETEARSFLSKYLFTGDDVFTPVENLSYGERARLSLACLVAQGCNLLILDEPINHLDIPARTRFEKALAGFEGTILAVVHDRYFIEGFASEIWEVTGGKILVSDKLVERVAEDIR